MELTEKAAALMRLLEGFSEAYGTYNSLIPSEAKGGKLEIRATAQTKRGKITRDMWMAHLEGRQPMGIIPIRDNDTCLWGAIDIDSYDLDLAAIFDAVEREGLPLCVCRSKSGGAHLFLFMAKPVVAELMQMRLKEMAALLGYGSSEIFPKQKHVHLERGDLGSWLNMPYFEGDETDRYCVKKGGLAMTTSEFVRWADSRQQPPEFLEKQEFKKKPKNEENKDPDFGDGPPCMQHLAAVGYPEGMRNKGLFALATFAKKKYPADWTTVLERWNHRFFDPPLPSTEVIDIIRGHEKKDYNYTCRENPIAAHCNSAVCRTRRFGVGGEDDFPAIGGLSFIKTDPPIWFMDVGDTRLELTTDELQNYKSFHKVCMENLFMCFRMMKQDSWLQIVSLAMRDATAIEVTAEISTSGQFGELLEDFLMNRHKGNNVEDLLVGRPWEDETAGRHYFRIRDLQRHLEASGFKIYNRGQITARVKGLGGDHHFFNLKGKGVNVWWVPTGSVSRDPTPDVPPVAREPI